MLTSSISFLHIYTPVCCIHSRPEEMFGQRRPRMAVLVHLATDASGAMERSKVRLATASERLLPQACQGGEGSAAVPTRWTLLFGCQACATNAWLDDSKNAVLVCDEVIYIYSKIRAEATAPPWYDLLRV